MSQDIVNTADTGYTSAPPAAAANVATPILPEFIRLPKTGMLCGWTGLSRTRMWMILKEGKVRTVCLRKAGAAKGARLVHLKSLLNYLNSLAEGDENV